MTKVNSAPVVATRSTSGWVSSTATAGASSASDSSAASRSVPKNAAKQSGMLASPSTHDAQEVSDVGPAISREAVTAAAVTVLRPSTSRTVTGREGIERPSCQRQSQSTAMTIIWRGSSAMGVWRTAM